MKFNSSVLEDTAFLKQAGEILKSWGRRCGAKLAVCQGNDPSPDLNGYKEKEVKNSM